MKTPITTLSANSKIYVGSGSVSMAALSLVSGHIPLLFNLAVLEWIPENLIFPLLWTSCSRHVPFLGGCSGVRWQYFDACRSCFYDVKRT